MKGRESEPRWSRQKTHILYKKIKHISNRKFQSKPVPMNAERFKLSKYMSFGHIRSFLAFPGDRKEKSHRYLMIISRKFFLFRDRINYLLAAIGKQ